ncbi:MAG: hypothetical protein AAFO79_09090, partial [Pseudomonadota bacterium]
MLRVLNSRSVRNLVAGAVSAVIGSIACVGAAAAQGFVAPSGGNGQLNYNIWVLSELSSSNAFYNNTTHRNNNGLKYGDFPGHSGAPTSSGSAAAIYSSNPPFRDDRGGFFNNPSNGQFLQIEGFLAFPEFTSSLAIRTRANGSPAGTGSTRENFTTLHLGLDASNNPSRLTSDLQLVAQNKTNFQGNQVSLTEYSTSDVDLSGKWVAFGNAVSDGAD